MEVIENKRICGCNGLQPSELLSAAIQVGTYPGRGIASVVIMLWPITYRSSAKDVRDNDHRGPSFSTPHCRFRAGRLM